MTEGRTRDSELTIALREEIGEPEIFTGRIGELDYFLTWAERTKRQRSQSHAILARKRRGKTALVQRLFNILYTQNDPQVIPFYFRIENSPVSLIKLSDEFYRRLLSQYFAFKFRRLDLCTRLPSYRELCELSSGDAVIHGDVTRMDEIMASRDSEGAFSHAREAGHRISSLKDERIVQIIDEFQYLNEYVYLDDSFNNKIEVAGSYHGTASSKVSPVIATGSYIGWLTSVVRKMVGRFREYYLGPFEADEALAAVYNLSSVEQIAVTDETATYIADACHRDPFYIAALFSSRYPGRDLSSRDSVRQTLTYEITAMEGQIAKMWTEYAWAAFEKLNDRNAKRVVLYLAKYGDELRSRKQILEDLHLEITDRELEQLLDRLARADMIQPTSSHFHFKGLGDPVFEMVFRRFYQAEIEAVDLDVVDRDIERKLRKARGQASCYKGLAAEYRVVNRLLKATWNEFPWHSCFETAHRTSTSAPLQSSASGPSTSIGSIRSRSISTLEPTTRLTWTWSWR